MSAKSFKEAPRWLTDIVEAVNDPQKAKEFHAKYRDVLERPKMIKKKRDIKEFHAIFVHTSDTDEIYQNMTCGTWEECWEQMEYVLSSDPFSDYCGLGIRRFYKVDDEWRAECVFWRHESDASKNIEYGERPQPIEKDLMVPYWAIKALEER